MFKKIIIIFFISSFQLCFAQKDTLQLSREELFKVDSIKIVGNDKTEDFIILRELTFAVGDSVSANDLEFNKQRLFSLKLFYFVEFYTISENGFNVLEIYLKETWYIFPLPILRIQDNDISRSNYGAMLVWNNFRGKNETITAFASLGYDPSYGISFFSPVFIPDDDISINISFVYQNINNKSSNALELIGNDFKYDYFGSNLNIGKRLNIYNDVSLRTGFQYVYSKSIGENITASGNNIDRVPLLGFEYIYDSRNLKQFADNGLFTGLAFDYKGFGLGNISYFVVNLDFREYRNITGDFSSKWRVKTRNTFGKTIPLYDYSYLGFSEYVRGYKQSEREGHNLILSTIEFAYPIVKDWDFTIDLLFLPPSLTSARISIYLTAFGETGSTYNNGESIGIKNFDSGFGGGITFLFLPRNALRLEYAINDLGKGEFVLGTKLSFWYRTLLFEY